MMAAQYIRRALQKDEKLRQFYEERGITESALQGTVSSLKQYMKHCKFKNTTEMLNEALEDEKNRVPLKETRLNEHLRSYLRYLRTESTLKTNASIHTYYCKIETFYRHFDITIPHRPPLVMKKEYHVGYDDLPSKEMIRTAIEQSDAKLSAIIYFMSSSGSAAAETVSLTVGAFITGLKEYTTEHNPEKVIKELQGRRDLVPVIKMVRKKTNEPYYTCCSSEATYHILNYMDLFQLYDAEQPVFKIQKSYLSKHLGNINDNNNWGRVGSYRRFRSHALRKYHASNLGAPFELINTLEGRTNGIIHETYVKQRPEEIKEQYMVYMHNVMLYPELFEGPHCGAITTRGIVQEELKKQQLVQTETINPVSNQGNTQTLTNPLNQLGGGVVINGNVNIFQVDQDILQVLTDNGIDITKIVQKK